MVGRWAVVSAALVLAATLAPNLAGASHYQATLEGSNFEIDTDANLKVDVPTTMDDWASVVEARREDAPTGRNDDSFSGGSKEDDTCPGTTTGSIPNNKSDLLTFGVYEEPNHPGFLHLFWTRVQEPSGTTLMDFELNQSNVDCGNGVNRARTVGDLLIEYRIEQGGATAQILVREWTGSAWGPEQDLTAVGQATGTINNSAIPAGESDGFGALSARTFGEASIDLDFIFDENECRSFGSAFLKSRSSTSFTSQLKDFIAPVPVEISNCGTIVIEKQTDPDGAPDSFGFTTTGGLTPATFSLTDGGTRTYNNVLAGVAYTVSEDAAAGDLTSIVCTGGTTSTNLTTRTASITLSADETVRCVFTNVLKGSILVHKVDDSGALLGGAGFTITPGNIVMASPSTGVFCTDNLAFATYTITETTVPAGYIGAGPQNFTVNSTKTCAQKIGDGDSPDRSFTNSVAPGRINVFKADDDGAPLNGAVFTLYADDGDGAFEGGADDAVVGTCTTGVSNFGDAATPAAGTCSFLNVNPGGYWVDETTVPAGYSKAGGLPTAVTVGLGATPGTGQTINLPSDSTSFVNPQTHKVIVIVCHEGTPKLAASDVTNGTDSQTTLATGATLPDGVSEADLCGLDGFTGKPHGNKSLTVDVGSDAHGS